MRLIDAERMPNDEFFKGMTDIEKAKVLQWFVSAPTVDAVEVTRCEDCKHFLQQYDTQTGQKLCYGICRLNSNKFHDEEVNRNHYCGYGKLI